MVRTIFITLKSILKKRFQKCRHEKVTSTNKSNFCPDCGRKLELNWLVASCSDCNTERETILIFGQPYSIKKKCPLCQSTKYKIIRKSSLPTGCGKNFVLIKSEIPDFIGYLDLNSSYPKTKAKYLNTLKNDFTCKGLYKVDTTLIK